MITPGVTLEPNVLEPITQAISPDSTPQNTPTNSNKSLLDIELTNESNIQTSLSNVDTKNPPKELSTSSQTTSETLIGMEDNSSYATP